MLAAEARLTGRRFDDDAPAIVERPEGLVRESVCAVSGMRAGDACLSRTSEWLTAGAESGPLCTWHHESEGGPVVVWPDRYREWAAATGRVVDAAQAPTRPAAVRLAEHVSPDDSVRGTAGANRLTIVSPADGAVYLIDPTLRPEFQTVSLRASAEPASDIQWSVDGRLLGRAHAEQPMAWPLTPGRHVIEASDDHGRRTRTTIVVK